MQDGPDRMTKQKKERRGKGMVDEMKCNAQKEKTRKMTCNMQREG